MKLQVFIALFLFSLNASSQFEVDDFGHGISLRGKVLAGPTSPENNYDRMFTIGSEYRFFNYHALGLDYVSFRDRYSHESLSAAGFYENDGTYTFTKRTYVLVDYRFYLNFWETVVTPYVNVLTKFGHQDKWFYDGGDDIYEYPYNYSSTFNEYGFAIGGHFGFTRVGADISIGAMKSYNNIKYGHKIYDMATATWVNDPDYLEIRWKPHMRLNVYINLFTIKPKK